MILNSTKDTESSVHCTLTLSQTQTHACKCNTSHGMAIRLIILRGDTSSHKYNINHLASPVLSATCDSYHDVNKVYDYDFRGTDRNNNNYEASHADNKGVGNNPKNNNNSNLGFNNNCSYGVSNNIMADATKLWVAKQFVLPDLSSDTSATKLDLGPESYTASTSNNNYNNNNNFMHNLGHTTTKDLIRFCITRSFLNNHCYTYCISGYSNLLHMSPATSCRQHYPSLYSVTLYCDLVLGGFCSKYVKLSLANHGNFQLQLSRIFFNNHCNHYNNLTYNHINCNCYTRYITLFNYFFYKTTATTCRWHYFSNYSVTLYCDIVLGGFCSMNVKTSLANHGSFQFAEKMMLIHCQQILSPQLCSPLRLRILFNNFLHYATYHTCNYNNNNIGWRNVSNKEMHATNGNIPRRQLPKRRSLAFGWWNCQKGFINQGKKLELESFLIENNVDVFGVQEVEIYKTTYFYSDLYRIRGYKHIFPSSLEKQGRGRCVVYFKEGLQELITERLDLMSPTQPIIWLQLGPRKGPLLAFYYREWTGLDGVNTLEAQKTRLQEVLDKVSKAMEGNNELYLMGDLNVDSKAVNDLSSADPLAKMINDTMIEEGLDQLITKTTRSQLVNNVCRESSIDHLYTNVPENTMGIKIHHTASSDHAMITFKRRRKVVIPRRRITIRSFKNFKEADFLKELGGIDWKSMPDNNVDEATEFLTSSILNVLDEHAPVITFTPSSNYNPVISEFTKGMMKKRDLAQEKAKQTGNAEHVKEYKQLRNQVVGLIDLDKKAAVESEMEKGSSAWKALNIMRSKSKSAHGPPTKLILNGKVVNDTTHMATSMNEFFTEKIKKLQEEIGKNDPAYDPVDHLKANLPDNIETLDWSLTSPLEVKETIEHLQNSSSAGPDGISNWILKKAKEVLASPLSRLFNMSLSLATYPTSWKQATVLPLWKKKSKLDPASYRPISLTCKCSILFEKLMQKRLTTHLKAQNLFAPEQDGYQDGKSTITLTTRAYDKWCRAASKSRYSGILCIDLSSAFDMVPGTILVDKARALGASEQAARWLSSYLSGRTQTVKIGSSVSSVIPIPSSICQGTAFGPLLFLLSVLDLPRCVYNGSVDMFCDDITDTVEGDNPFLVARQLEEDAENITRWLISNRLCIAKDKTNFMLATNREKPRTQDIENITIKVAGQTVEQCQHFKLLGITFQRDLTFSLHLHGTQGENPEKGLIRSLSQIIGIIRSIKHCPKKAKKMFLASLFNGKLSYGIEVYGALTEGQLHQLQLVQNRAAKLVMPGNKLKTADKLKELGWLNVKETREKMDLLTLLKIRLHRSSPYFDKWFRSSRIPPHATLPTYEDNHGKLLQRSWLVRAKASWNQLPLEVRKSTLPSFKKNLKRHLLARQR